jgi:hypothetical protein
MEGKPMSGAGTDWTQDNLTPEAINALQHKFVMERQHTEGDPISGYLSTLVWNTRNNYLAVPGCSFSAEQVRAIVEGFMAEVARIEAGQSGPSVSCYHHAPKSAPVGPAVVEQSQEENR